MSCDLLQIDTKGICLLCFAPNKPFQPDIKKSPSLQGFKELLRYLQVNTKDLFNCSPQFLQAMQIGEEINVQITLCFSCSSVTEKFDKLYKDYELIRLQFDNCVQTLTQSMKNGDDSPHLVRGYMTQMQPHKSSDLVNASIAANLRSETYRKCLQKLQTGAPRVVIQKGTGIPPPPQVSSNKIYLPSYSVPKNSSQVSSDHVYSHPVPSKVSTPPPVPPTSVFKPSPVVPADTNYSSRDGGDTVIKVVRVSHGYSFEENNDSDEDDPLSVTESTNLSDPLGSDDGNEDEGIQLRRIGCDLCSAKFTSETYLVRHHHTTHQEHTIAPLLPPDIPIPNIKRAIDALCNQLLEARSCRFCDAVYTKRRLLLNHLMDTHKRMFAGEVYKHIQTYFSGAVPLPTTYSLGVPKPQKSMIRKRLTGSEKCTVCHKGFPTQADVERHKVVHLNSYPCEFCEYVTNYSVNLKYHKLDKHTAEVVMPLLPEGTCKKKCGVAAHTILGQYGQFNGQCPKCGVKLANKSTGLRRHMLGQHFDDFMDDLRNSLMEVGTASSGGSGGGGRIGSEKIVPEKPGNEVLKMESSGDEEEMDFDPLALD